tara:strand:+ start:90 stop:422 length:333 start_codon:yes stop_codon:yes gene_type:complete
MSFPKEYDYEHWKPEYSHYEQLSITKDRSNSKKTYCKCEWSNFIPRTQNNDNKNEWTSFYDEELKDILNIVKNNIDNKFPTNNINWENEYLKLNLINVIYHCSSKYIPEY